MQSCVGSAFLAIASAAFSLRIVFNGKSEKRMVQCVTEGRLLNTSESSPRTHMGSPYMRTGRQTKKIACGDSPYTYRGCVHMVIYLYTRVSEIEALMSTMLLAICLNFIFLNTRDPTRNTTNPDLLGEGVKIVCGSIRLGKTFIFLPNVYGMCNWINSSPRTYVYI
jgi:hypothetical protein